MREFLDFPADWDPARLNEIGGHFPVDRVFSLIGTNHTDYNLARLALGPGSDGLVLRVRDERSNATRHQL
jgi:hypothetical protein